MSQSYLKPKHGTPEFMRKVNNGQFVNPPPYVENWGGFTSASALNRSKQANMMGLEKGGPQARRGKPI